MNELKIIDQREVLNRNFTMYGDFDNPLFLAKDVAEWIEHSDVSTMMRTVDESEKLIQTMFVSGQKRECLCLTEDGLYEVLMQSRKPIAKQFKAKVKEILREIRKTGKYETPKQPRQAKPNLSSVNNAVKIIGQYMKQAGIGEDIQLLTVKGLYAQAGVLLPIDIAADKMYYDTKVIAQQLGMNTKTGKPAYHAVSQIIKQLDIFTDEVKEVWEDVDGWQGVVKKYSDSVIVKVEEWLIENGYPTTIAGINKNYHVVYDIAA